MTLVERRNKESESARTPLLRGSPIRFTHDTQIFASGISFITKSAAIQNQ